MSISAPGVTVSSSETWTPARFTPSRSAARSVDARYLEASIPATHAIPFDVASGARVVAVNDLPAAAETASSYAVLGSGKTAVDACMWLLDNDVGPDRIRWIRPRDAWFYDRRHFQPLEQVGNMIEGLALDAEAGAHAATVDELFERLEASGRLLRIDPTRPATMYRGTMLSAGELAALRQIEDVIRLGRVRRIEADRILLERGEARTSPGTLHVDCTALGLTDAPAQADLRAGSNRAPAGAPPLALLQRGSDRLPRGPPRRRRREEPALSPQPVSRQHRGLAKDDEPHLEDRGAMAGASPISRRGSPAAACTCLRALPDHATEPSVQGPLQLYLTHVSGRYRAARATGRLEISRARTDRPGEQQQRRDPARTPRVYS